MGDSDSTARSDASIALRELAWLIHRHAPERAGVGPIPTTEIALLKQVIDNPGSTIGELAAALGLLQPNVSTAIRILEQRGFVERQKSESDRRVSRILATGSGIAEHQAISDGWAQPVDRALASLTPDQRVALDGAADALDSLQAFLRRRLADD